MRRKPAGMWTAAGALALVSCSNGSPAPDRLVDYAEGNWACDIDGGTERTVDATVTVTADGAASGAYTAQLASEGTPPTTIEGEWELDGTDLQVTALDEVVRYAIEGVDLDTEHVEVVEGGRGHLQGTVGVDVERPAGGDDLAFRWSHPLTDEPVNMSCSRA